MNKSSTFFNKTNNQPSIASTPKVLDKQLTIKEAASLLGVSEKTLRRWEAKGIIKAPQRINGNQRSYDLEDIQKLQDNYITIGQAAEKLNISIATLRRWEQKGLIAPKRTDGNQRRYDISDIEKFLFKSTPIQTPSPAPVIKQTPTTPPLPTPNFVPFKTEEFIPKPVKIEKPINQTPQVFVQEEYVENEPEEQKYFSPQVFSNTSPKGINPRVFITISLSLILLTATGIGAHIGAFNFDKPTQEVKKFISMLPNMANNLSEKPINSFGQQVLQAATKNPDFAIKIGVPISFTSTASVAGTLTAPNILYGITAGTNISITGDLQNPTISATSSGGVTTLQGSSGALNLTAGGGISLSGLTITNSDAGSDQDIFANVKVGSTTISAGSNTDTLELSAGTGITLAADTSNKKVTITSSPTFSGLTTNGVLYADSTTTLTSLTPGTSGYVLQSNGSGSPPSWVSGAANPAFSAITDGTNTQAAMVVGSGASLTYSGGTATSGVINANQLLGGTWAIPGSIGATTAGSGAFTTLSVTPGSDTNALTLTGTNVTTQKLAYLNANNVSGTIFDISYGSTQTLTGSLIGQSIDLNNGQVTATNQSVTGEKIVLPTITNTHTSGTKNLLGLQVTFGSGAGINQNGAGGTTVFSNLDLNMPALTQTAGTLTANGLAVTTPSGITTGGTANGVLLTPTGVGAGTLNGINLGTISSAGGGTENAISVGTGWDSILKVNGTSVINGSGVTQAVGGGTGQSSYTVGDILYADTTTSLTKLAIGGTEGYVLKVSSGVPAWGTVSGSNCTTCVVTNPSSDQSIAPTGQATTGLIVKQTSTASPTDDIFQVTDSAGTTKYFYVDKDGNVSTGAISNTTLTLTPTTNTTALTLVGTNVTSANLQYINAKNSSGTIFNLAYGATQTLSTSSPTTAIGVDLSTNVTATNANVTGESLTLPAQTNTHTSGTKAVKGITISSGGGINNTDAGGTTTWTAFDATIPALTQTAGTLTGYGVNVTTPSSITTGGTAAGLNVTASGVGAGTLYGLNVGSITAGAGTETAIQIGTGWDAVLKVGSTTIIDGSGNLNLAGGSGIVAVANGGSPFEENQGAIIARLPGQDFLFGGLATSSATFHLYGASAFQGTNPVASIAANTSFSGLVVDNKGIGSIFTASSSGLTRFAIRNSGIVDIGTTAVTGEQGINVKSQNNAYLILNADTDNDGSEVGAPYIGFIQDGTGSITRYIGGIQTAGQDPAGGTYTDTAANAFLLGTTSTQDLQLGTGALVRFHLDGSNNRIGIGTTTPLSAFDIRNITDTLSVASVSGKSNSFAAMVVDNRGTGDIFTASSSGKKRFAIKNSGVAEVYSGAGAGVLKIGDECGANYIGISLNGTLGGTCGTGYNILSSTTDTNLYINTPTGGSTNFRENNSDKVEIAAASSDNSIILYARGANEGGQIALIHGTSKTNHDWFFDAGVQAGTNPDLRAMEGASAATTNVRAYIDDGVNGWQSPSDRRLKTNIQTLTNVLDKLKLTRGVTYDLIDGKPNQVGVIAQELRAAFPGTEIVSGDETEGYLGVNYGDLAAVAIQGVKELDVKTDNLALSTQNSLTLSGENFNNQILGLESNLASTSASITTQTNSQFSSVSSDILSLNTRIASIEASLDTLSVFSASSSAELSLDSININGSTITDSLNVLSYATINELSVTGNITAGLLTIKGLDGGHASINTLNGDLKLQSDGLGGIDILNGKVTVDTSGNITTTAEITAKKYNVDTEESLSSSAGSVVIETGETNIDVDTTALTPDSLIFVTPDQPVIVGAKKKDSNTFTIKLQSSESNDIKINWWIVN